MDCPLPAQHCRTPVDRVLYVFCCNSRLCTESADPAAVCVIINCRRARRDAAAAAAAPPPPRGLWDSIMSVDAAATALGSVTLGAETARVSHFDSAYAAAFPATALHIVDELIAVHRRAPAREPAADDARASGEEWQGEVYEKVLPAGYDKAFKNFHTRVAHYPRQCVRFAPRGQPLPFSPDPLPPVPPCAACGAARAFELQLMPAILSVLPASKDAFLQHIPEARRGLHPVYGDAMEWGTILVYTCGVCDLDASGRNEIAAEGFAILQVEKDHY